MRKNVIPIGLILVLGFLVISKLVLSGYYLKSGSVKLTGANLAHASEKVTAKSPKIGLAMQLKKKEIELQEWEERLKKKEAALLPVEKEVESKMAELNELQAKLTSLARELAKKEKSLKEGKMGHLVALYTAMEPNKAAAIMEKLKINTVVLILSNMKGKSAGKILAMMAPEKGAVISEKLSKAD